MISNPPCCFCSYQISQSHFPPFYRNCRPAYEADDTQTDRVVVGRWIWKQAASSLFFYFFSWLYSFQIWLITVLNDSSRFYTRLNTCSLLFSQIDSRTSPSLSPHLSYVGFFLPYVFFTPFSFRDAPVLSLFMSPFFLLFHFSFSFLNYFVFLVQHKLGTVVLQQTIGEWEHACLENTFEILKS